MAGSKSDSYSDDFLNVVRTNTSRAGAGTSVYVELYSVAPTDAGGGTASGEGRQAIAATSGWDAIEDASVGSGRQIKNSGVITWSSWASGSMSLVAFGIFDASTAGNLLYWADLDTSRSIANGETASFAAGDLKIVED